MGTTDKTINFTYNFIDIQLLEWNAGTGIVKGDMTWQPEFEIAFDHISKSYPVVYLDAALYLRENADEYAAMIKVRSVFSISRFEGDKYPAGVIAWLLEFAISHCRAISVCKCTEENIMLPLIPYFTFDRLCELASLTLFKPSVTALSHGKVFSMRNISQATGFDKLKVIILWFLVAADSNVVSLHGRRESQTASINFNYDYEQIVPGQWKLHIDFGINLTDSAEIKVRTSYAVACSENELFSVTTLMPMVKEAYHNCLFAFKEQCSVHNINLTNDIDPGEEYFQSVSENAIKQYFESRKKDDEHNRRLLTPGLQLTVGGNTRLVVKGTFMIMDEIMFLNPAFNNSYNRELLAGDMIHETLYYTVKYNCLEIENGTMQLSWMHTVIFYICLDIAMQLLVSDHADALQPVLLKNNFTALRQQEFIRFSSDLFKSFNETTKKGGMRITNLEVRKDWTSLIR